MKSVTAVNEDNPVRPDLSDMLLSSNKILCDCIVRLRSWCFLLFRSYRHVRVIVLNGMSWLHIFWFLRNAGVDSRLFGYIGKFPPFDAASSTNQRHARASSCTNMLAWVTGCQWVMCDHVTVLIRHGKAARSRRHEAAFCLFPVTTTVKVLLVTGHESLFISRHVGITGCFIISVWMC